MAISTFGASPGVVMSWSEMWTWKAETPARVPAGARISAGNSGRVARSLPIQALTLVKRSPVSCIPSPESPAKRMTTAPRDSGACGRSAMSVMYSPTSGLSSASSSARAVALVRSVRTQLCVRP